jgi:methylmalonyl-CoA mutase N-terminal domain/subunit
MASEDNKLRPEKTLSGLPLQALYEADPDRETVGAPGTYPFLRGPYATMYRSRRWTMRQFAGFGSPEDTNERFQFLLEEGQDGLSTAFDMPTLMGYDADHPRAFGEVGREGVSISTIADAEILFRDIPLDQVSTSMTINCSASILLAMYIALAERRGIPRAKLSGTIQNDMLKEFIAQKEWISPPEPSVRVVADMIEFCAEEMPRWHAVSISGYHIREAGATAIQEVAFTLADGLAYIDAVVSRGRLSIDDFGHRLSFFFDIHNDFFEEIAKLRAARRLWAKLVRERYGAKKEEACRLRMHGQTAGVSLTAQQPLNNIVRVTLQALAGVLGGVQSLHTNSFDETFALPTEDAVTLALRTQQIIAEESGVANIVDPLGGSYAVEALTDAIEKAARDLIDEIDARGGMIAAIDEGFPQTEISESAWQTQCETDRGERITVGVNGFRSETTQDLKILRIPPELEKTQIKRVQEFKAGRDPKSVENALNAIRKAAEGDQNLMPHLIKAVDLGCSVGEISDIYRDVFGEYRDPGHL